MARSTVAPVSSPVLASAGITVRGGEFRALLRRRSGVESRRFANHPGGYDAWDAWLASRGIGRVRVCLAADDPSGDDLAIYLSETGHDVRLVDEGEIETRPDARLLLDLAALGEGERFAPPARFAMPERYARVSWR
jgi:hypothetical protein